jgi:uncharacterized membrane protein YozB (DUF420 family)
MPLFNIVATIWAIISFTLLVLAWRMAVAKKIRLHRNLMIVLTTGAWIFIANYLFLRPYSGEALTVPREYIIWMAFHGTAGLIPLIGATCLVVSRIRRRGSRPESYLNRQHKFFGRVIIALWLFSHLGGIFNAFLLN